MLKLLSGLGTGTSGASAVGLSCACQEAVLRQRLPESAIHGLTPQGSRGPVPFGSTPPGWHAATLRSEPLVALYYYYYYFSLSCCHSYDYYSYRPRSP